jgi:hypothetical protein
MQSIMRMNNFFRFVLEGKSFFVFGMVVKAKDGNCDDDRNIDGIIAHHNKSREKEKDWILTLRSHMVNC